MILRFHPDLHYLFGPELEIEAATPLDALKLVATQHHLVGKMEPVPVRIEQLTRLDLLDNPTLAESGSVYDIIPAALELEQAGYSGAGGDNPVVNIIIGIILVVVASFLPQIGIPALKGFFAAGSISAGILTAVTYIGASLVLQGLMQLLAPKPKENKLEGNLQSRIFDTSTTTEIGTTIPIVFGRHLAPSHLFSFNVDARAYNGIDDPDNSPYFKGKTDEYLPTINKDKFYGIIRAGDNTVIKQVDNEFYRTGREF